MNMRVLALCAVGALLLVGCSGGDSGSSATTASGASATSSNPTQGNDFKVALLTLGKVDDAGWNALAYKGLQAIHTETGADVANKENSNGPAIKDDLRSYAQQKYNLIIGHGYEYNAPSKEVGKDFPGTVFVATSGSDTAPNVGTVRFELEQGFYLAGILAAKMTKSGIVAEVAGEANIPPIESTFNAFDAGARSVNPKIQIKRVYAGSSDDIAKAQQVTETVIGQGADVVIHQADNAAQGVFNACKAKHVYAIGANADQNANDSGEVIASAVIIADPAFVELAKEVKAGTYKGNVTKFGMAKGAIDFVINPAMKDKVPTDVVKLLDETKQQIIAGKVAVPEDKF
jgi:basic membrane lipoprotein Med (substrate-binding protein (PBP1-ABC) superfamily)